MTMTVNQDDLFEKALSSLRSPGQRVPRVHVTQQEWESHRAGDFLKLHGEIARPETIVMSVEETRILPPWKKDKLAPLLTNATVLFIGYSLRDEDVRELLREVPARWYCVDPFVSPSFRLPGILRHSGLIGKSLGMSAETALASMSSWLPIGYRAMLWSASAGSLAGHYRDRSDEWNFQTLPALWRKCRVIGSSPGRDATRDWAGGEIRFHYHVEGRALRDLRNASLAVHVPPGDGKGIHGVAGSAVHVTLATDIEKDIPAARFVCNRVGDFQNYYAHSPGNRAPRVSMTRQAVDALRKARWLEISLRVPAQCCMDMHEVCLHLNDDWAVVGNQ
jgi:SIR2-like domain